MGDLVGRAGEQFSTLVRDEIQLAQAELKQKARHAGAGAGLFGTGGLLAFYGLAALIGAGVLGLALVWPGWLAALAVGGALVVIAGLLVLAGRAQMRRATPPTPLETVDSVRADLQAVGAAVDDRRRR